MTERDEAIELASRVLDKPYIDPDGDICVLARQFLRALESQQHSAAISIVRRFVALPSGAWHPERHAAEEMELMQEARALLATLDGEVP